MPENPPRLTFTEYGLYLAFGASLRATCRRRLVGCALFNNKRIVVATGYNGAPSGAPQCDEVGCLMADGHCARINHAEKNAILFAGDRDLKEGYSFTTIRPCKKCFDLLVSKEIKHMYYLEDYRNDDDNTYIKDICEEKKIILEKISLNIVQLLQKSLNLHQGPGGLLISYDKLTIEEHIPEMMDH